MSEDNKIEIDFCIPQQSLLDLTIRGKRICSGHQPLFLFQSWGKLSFPFITDYVPA